MPFSEYGPGMMLFFLFVFATGIIACAIYPTWVATKYTARQLINNKSSTSGLWLTSILTTFQYATALSLIVLILVSHTQLRFILSKELGINKENVVVFEAPVIGLEEDGVQKMIAFTEQLKSESNTSEITLSGRVPGDYPYMAIVRSVAGCHPGLDYVLNDLSSDMESRNPQSCGGLEIRMSNYRHLHTFDNSILK
nr:MAG: hypothetical protein DIU61_17920 [Bacteroidota bacterium]